VLRKKILSSIFAVTILSASFTPQIQASRAWSISKLALYSLIGVGCAVKVAAKTLKKSLDLEPVGKESSLLHLGLLTIISCYSLVHAYDTFQELKKDKE